MTLGPDEDLAKNNSMLFADYFDQPELESHDYLEQERFTRIDSAMLDVLVKYTVEDASGTAVSSNLDKREWQQSDYVFTATGFITSQTTSQDGIIYRELKR